MKALKHLILLLLFATAKLCAGQGVRFQFYRTKACSTVEKLDTAYSLYKIDGHSDSSYFPKAGTVYLPGTGWYHIFANGAVITTEFHIRDTGLFVFRFKEPDHGLYVTGAFDDPARYSSCDSLLNGYQEYHYDNGGLEMRGTFKYGNPKDSMVTFYRNGQVREKLMRHPKVVIITRYDSLGHRLSLDRNQNKSFMVYWEYHHEEFYLDGQVKRKVSSVRRIKRIIEFYPNGGQKLIQTKRYRTDYYNNGLTKVTYKWTYKRDHDTHSQDFTIYKTEYDTTGQISRKTIYQQWWTHPAHQPILELKRSNWIVSSEKYMGGNVIFSVKGMDTKEFIKKYPNELVNDEEDDMR